MKTIRAFLILNWDGISIWKKSISILKILDASLEIFEILYRFIFDILQFSYIQMFSDLKKHHSRYPSINGFEQSQQSESERDETLKKFYFTSEEKIKQEKVAILKIKIDELQSLLSQTNKENQILMKLNKSLTETLKCVNEDIQKIFTVRNDEEDEQFERGAFKQRIENKPCEILQRVKEIQDKIEGQESVQNQFDSPRFKRHNNFRDKVSLLSYRNSCQNYLQKAQEHHKGFPTIKIPNQRKSSIDYVKNNDIQTKKILTYTNTPRIPDNFSVATNLTKDKRGNYNQSESLNIKLSDRKSNNNRQEMNYQYSPRTKNAIVTTDELPLSSKMRIAGSINLAPNLSYRTKQSPKSPRNYLNNPQFEKKLVHNKSSDYIMKQSIQEIWAKAQPKLNRQKSYELTQSYFNHTTNRRQQQKPSRNLNELRSYRKQQNEYNKFNKNILRNQQYSNLDYQGKSYLNLQPQSKISLNEDISFSNRSYLALKIKSPRNLNQKSAFMKSGKRLFC